MLYVAEGSPRAPGDMGTYELRRLENVLATVVITLDGAIDLGWVG